MQAIRDQQTGNMKFTERTETMLRSGIILAGDIVICKDAPGSRGEVLAVDGETAEVQWTLHTRTKTRLHDLVPVSRKGRMKCQ